jgi:hypothetical protein
MLDCYVHDDYLFDDDFQAFEMTERCCLVYCTETVAYDSLDLIGDVDFNLEPGVGRFGGFDDGVHLSVLFLGLCT